MSFGPEDYTEPHWFEDEATSFAELHYRAAAELAAEFGHDISEWLV